MKKLLSILLCMLMLLSSFAAAEGREFTVSNIAFSAGNGMFLDFSGIDLRLQFGESDAISGARLSLEADGREVLSGVAGMADEQLLLSLDGMSRVYSLDLGNAQADQVGFEFLEADVEAIAALLEDFWNGIEESAVETGMEYVGDVSFRVLEVSAEPQAFDALFGGVAAVLDKYTELAQQISPANGSCESFTEFYAGLNMEFSGYGTIWTAEEDDILDLYFPVLNKQTGEEKLMNLYADSLLTRDAANGVDSRDVSISLAEVTEDEEYIERLAIGGSIGLVSGTDEIYGMDGYAVLSAVTEDAEDTGLYFGLYSPEITGIGMWQASLGLWDESVTMDVFFDEDEGGDGLYGTAYFAGGEISFFYAGEDGAGTVGVALVGEDASYELTADVALADADTAWLNVDGANAIAVETMTDTQKTSMAGELMALLMRAALELAAANDTVGALAGSLMG